MRLRMPLDKISKICLNFKQKAYLDKKYWGIHLGVDFPVRAGEPVKAIGAGMVVYSNLHPGRLAKNGKILKRNWGGIIIIRHKNASSKKFFYSLYGHLGKRLVKKTDSVKMGDTLGRIGKSLTLANGLWEEEHLHFAIYSGPYAEAVLPGYYRKKDMRTKINYWRNPISFIKNFSN